MSVEKLSVSLEAELAKVIRSRAAEGGMSVSTWLSEAARVKARQGALREELADFAQRHGALSAAEAEKLVATARAKSVVTRPRGKRP